MSLADAAPILTALGGIGGIGAAVRWWLDRAERIRREDEARADAREERSAARYEAMGRALAQSAAAIVDLAHDVERVPAALDALGGRVDRMERTVDARLSPATGEHRAGGAS